MGVGLGEGVEMVAFQMPIEDGAMQAYLQGHPFAMGPDAAMDERCKDAIRREFGRRPVGSDDGSTVRLKPDEALLNAEALERVKELMDRAGISVKARDGMINDFGWEAERVPRGSKELLVLGCGDGVELMFLRAVLPEVRITAVDYYDNVKPALKEAVGLTFFGGDINKILDGLEPKYDLVFSNHTLEHLYTPDKMLAKIFGLLVAGGALVSTLPMDAMPGGAHAGKLAAIAGSGGEIHPLDYVYLDAGHPWKTNPADLRATFQRAGFAKVELFQRAEHLSRYVAATEKEFRAGLERGLRWNAAVFGTIRGLLKAVYPRSAPRGVVRLILAADRRVWFGVNTLKNKYSQEACVRAVKG